jgi:hypothetical protein
LEWTFIYIQDGTLSAVHQIRINTDLENVLAYIECFMKQEHLPPVDGVWPRPNPVDCEDQDNFAMLHGDILAPELEDNPSPSAQYVGFDNLSPSTADPYAADPSAADSSIADSSTAGPSTADPSAADPSAGPTSLSSGADPALPMPTCPLFKKAGVKKSSAKTTTSKRKAPTETAAPKVKSPTETAASKKTVPKKTAPKKAAAKKNPLAKKRKKVADNEDYSTDSDEPKVTTRSWARGNRS